MISKALRSGYQHPLDTRIVLENDQVSDCVLGLTACLGSTLKQVIKGKSRDDDARDLLYALASTTCLLSYCSFKIFQTIERDHQLLNLLSLVYSSVSDLRTRLWILRLASLLVHRVYFEPVAQNLFSSDAISHPDEAHWQGLCDLLLYWFQKCPTDTHLVYLQNTPLLVDLDIAVGIVDRFADCDHARWNYLYKAMQGLHRSAGTLETKERFKNAKKTRLDTRVPTTLVPTLSTNEEFIHMTSLISQVKDLFPDLGEGFIEVSHLSS